MNYSRKSRYSRVRKSVSMNALVNLTRKYFKNELCAFVKRSDVLRRPLKNRLSKIISTLEGFRENSRNTNLFFLLSFPAVKERNQNAAAAAAKVAQEALNQKYLPQGQTELAEKKVNCFLEFSLICPFVLCFCSLIVLSASQQF